MPFIIMESTLIQWHNSPGQGVLARHGLYYYPVRLLRCSQPNPKGLRSWHVHWLGRCEKFANSINKSTPVAESDMVDDLWHRKSKRRQIRVSDLGWDNQKLVCWYWTSLGIIVGEVDCNTGATTWQGYNSWISDHRVHIRNCNSSPPTSWYLATAISISWNTTNTWHPCPCLWVPCQKWFRFPTKHRVYRWFIMVGSGQGCQMDVR